MELFIVSETITGMELSFDDTDGVRTIRLKGRMDVEGASLIDLKFTSLTCTERAFIVVDLTDVEFMASMGLATLVRCARSLRQRQGNMVIFNPKPLVRQVIASTRIDQVVPVFSDIGSARLAAMSPPADHAW